jgi:hypothetical protein
MSEGNKKVEQNEQAAEASELSEQDLDKIAGGAPQATTTAKPTTTANCWCQTMPGKSW